MAETALAALDLVSVVTPEITYANANLVHHAYRREARAGVTLLRVEKVRVTGVAEFSNTQSVNGAATQQGGTVQTQSFSLVPGAALAPPSTVNSG